MRIFLKLLPLTSFAIVLIALILLNLINPFETNFYKVSPIPGFLDFAKNKQISTLNIWKPQNNKVLSSMIKEPIIGAKSALIYDTATDQVLYEKNSKERLPIASLTKIMTAIIGIENKNKENKYYVSKEDLVGENSMGLTKGEVLGLEDLLYGLILNSGNDAAEVIAKNSLGRLKFIEAMNLKAKSLGLDDTHFTNPSGLQGNGDQYSTAYDLLIITNYALKYPIFKQVSATFEYSIEQNLNHKAFYLQNETNLLTSYPGVKGVKTGYTPEAELCLVTYLEHGKHKIIGVLLGSNNRRDEMKQLLDYSLKLLGEIPPPHP